MPHPVDVVIARMLRRREAGRVLRRHGVLRVRQRLHDRLRAGERTVIQICAVEPPELADLMLEALATALY